jgi:hypothetical protein
MSTTARFLPTQESALDVWLANFSGLISAAPASYGLSPADAAQIAAAVADWHKAYLVATSPATRTASSVADKRGEKQHVVRVVRSFAARIRADESIGDDLKINLGLKLRPRRGEPVPTPAGVPVLAVRRLDIGVHELRAMDGDTRPSRGKPPRVASIMVYRAVGDTPARSPMDADFLTLSTRVAFASTFSHSDHGKTATYFARWINSKGEAGPWSIAMSAPIAA